MIIAKGELGTLYAVEVDARATKSVQERIKRRGGYPLTTSGYKCVPGNSFFRQSIMYAVPAPDRDSEMKARDAQMGFTWAKTS